MRTALASMLFVLLAGSARAQYAGPALDDQLKEARSEQAAADKEATRLEGVAANARNEADRLLAQQAAAAQAVEAAEARITSADAEARLASVYVAAHRRQLVEEQRPASLLLAGLALMARRPPLLALADGGSTDELVKVRILLDSTLPAIRSRTAHISSELEQGRRLEQALREARAEMASGQKNLVAKRQQLAVLEQRALRRALETGGRALAMGDVALAAGEEAGHLQDAQSATHAITALAPQLVSEQPAPARPTRAEGPALKPPFAYALPASAPVTEGLGSVNASGMRSRGLTVATARGAPLTVPADGIVRFSGPFRDYDGVVIIDHGRGWISLLVNVSSNLRRGDKVRLGDPLGRALGPLLVELSQNGRRISPALIAGSSQSLSKGGKGG